MLYIPAIEREKSELEYEYQKAMRWEEYQFSLNRLVNEVEYDLNRLYIEFHPI